MKKLNEATQKQASGGKRSAGNTGFFASFFARFTNPTSSYMKTTFTGTPHKTNKK